MQEQSELSSQSFDAQRWIDMSSVNKSDWKQGVKRIYNTMRKKRQQNSDSQKLLHLLYTRAWVLDICYTLSRIYFKTAGIGIYTSPPCIISKAQEGSYAKEQKQFY